MHDILHSASKKIINKQQFIDERQTFVALLELSIVAMVIQRNRTNRILIMELPHVVMEAEKSHTMLSASWRADSFKPVKRDSTCFLQ